MIKFLAILWTLIIGFAITAQAQQRIEPNSAITISVKGVPAEDGGQISGIYKLDPDGTVTLPYIKPVHAAGLSPRAFANALSSAYKSAGIYTDPVFNVNVNISDTQLSQTKISVGGKVGNPGAKEYTSQMTLYDAILAAGWITDFGSPRIELTRKNETSIIDFNIDQNRKMRILPNDVIHVRERGPFESGAK